MIDEPAFARVTSPQKVRSERRDMLGSDRPKPKAKAEGRITVMVAKTGAEVASHDHTSHKCC